MTPDDPRHGSNAGAIQHWRDRETPCEPCGTAARNMRKRARLDTLRGRPRKVPLGRRAWQIVHDTPRNQLAAQVGIASDKLLRYDNRGPDMVVFRATRDKLLAAAGGVWTPVGIQRRLQALSRLGWSMRVVADETGIDMDGLKRLRRRKNLVFVRRYVAEAVVEAFARLEMQTPPPGASSTKTRVDAERAGWAPPLAWDDIDDPNEQPSNWQYVAPNRGDALRDLADLGVGITEACRRLRVGRDALEKWCQRHGMSDIYVELTARETAVFERRNQHTRESAA